MTLVWEEARRDGVGIFVAIAGGSSSGKTFTALRMATGIATLRNMPVAVVDTEAGRVRHYADQFVFKVHTMQPPFVPEKFAEAAADAERHGFGALIFDTFSSEWNAEGGLLEMQLADLDKRAGQDQAKRKRALQASWIEPKRRHKAMMSSFQQRRIPIFFVLRAEEKVKPAEDGGKPIPLGWVPIGDKRLKFELTCMFTLSPEHPGRFLVDPLLPGKLEAQHRHFFPVGELIGEAAGRGLWTWANSQAPGAPAPGPPAPAPAATGPAEASAAPPRPAPAPAAPPGPPAAADAQAPSSDAEAEAGAKAEAEARNFAASVRRKIEAAEDGEALRLLMQQDRVRRGRDRLRESYPDLDSGIAQTLAARTVAFGPAPEGPPA
jgi:hypothetical protein